MSQDTCAICDKPLGDVMYRSTAGLSLTSLCRIHPAVTEVRACAHCGHLQTRAIADVDDYYDTEYDILVASEEEDQVYEVRDGEPLYRTTHQVSTILAHLNFDRPLRLLDHGCAKSSTIRALCAINGNIKPHLFDVSSRYLPFWEKFVLREQWAVKDLPNNWLGKFDVVTSFFSLEHIPTVRDTMREIAGLLSPGGTFYAIVPNVLANIADFIVMDHCHHFTATSIQQLIANAGLELLLLDDQSHRGAFVVIARRPSDTQTAPTLVIAHTDVERTVAELDSVAAFWRSCATRVRAFEDNLTSDRMVAIYGAGFYGAFIRACLDRPEGVVCHLDQNPYLQGKPFNGSPVLAPSQLPDGIDTIFVGLNPAHARAIIADVPALVRPDLRFFYL